MAWLQRDEEPRRRPSHRAERRAYARPRTLEWLGTLPDASHREDDRRACAPHALVISPGGVGGLRAGGIARRDSHAIIHGFLNRDNALIFWTLGPI